MTVELRSPGQTTVAPDVLLSIARLTALGVAGVQAMGKAPLWKRETHTADGVRLQIVDGVVDLDLYLILEKDTNLRQVARDVQEAVTLAVSKMIGMQPGHINVHIEDIFFPETP
jgi:uncharacterized alkaline shock family protein YloU